MAAKVIWYRDACWVRIRHNRKKREKRAGSTEADKRRAEEIARKVNGAIAFGSYNPDSESNEAMPFTETVWRWHRNYSPTFKPSFEKTSAGLIRNHLAPFFGSKDLRSLTEEDLLRFIKTRLDQGPAPATVLNALSIVRRALNVLHRDGKIARNPANRLGELMRRVDRRTANEVAQVDSLDGK